MIYCLVKRGLQIGGFRLPLYAPHVVYTTRNEVDHRLQGMFIRGMCNYNVVELARGNLSSIGVHCLVLKFEDNTQQ